MRETAGSAATPAARCRHRGRRPAARPGGDCIGRVALEIEYRWCQSRGFLRASLQSQTSLPLSVAPNIVDLRRVKTEKAYSLPFHANRIPLNDLDLSALDRGSERSAQAKAKQLTSNVRIIAGLQTISSGLLGPREMQIVYYVKVTIPLIWLF
jgi:hypothetical protein